MWLWGKGWAQVSQMMIVLFIGILSPVIYSDDKSGNQKSHHSFNNDSPQALEQKQKQSSGNKKIKDKDKDMSHLPLKLEVVAILSDASNESLTLSKALGRALNSITSSAQLNELNPDFLSSSSPDSSNWDDDGGGRDQSPGPGPGPAGISLANVNFDSFRFPAIGPERNVTWRVRNFVIGNYSAAAGTGGAIGFGTGAAPSGGGGKKTGLSGSANSKLSNNNTTTKSNNNNNSNILSNRNNNLQQKSSSDNVNSNSRSGGGGGGGGGSRSGGGGGSNSNSGLSNSTNKSNNIDNMNNNEPTNNSSTTESVFSPSAMPSLCEFLSRTKAVAIINLNGDVGSERLLSLVSISAAIPLIGSAQYANPLQTLHKDSDDFYINLSTSVRHFARALGHLLVYCHWHSFAVLFDDSPSILSSQIIWEEELSQMKITEVRFPNPDPDSTDSSSFSSNYSDYDYEARLGGRLSNTLFKDRDNDGQTEPVLNPDFITLRTKSSNSAFRALSELTKATQGVIVLLCSQRSLIQVFRAAQQLRMLNGDYVFILVGQYNQFEVIPEWIPSGVLALRSPRSAQISKQTMKTTGKLLGSALISVKNQKVPQVELEEPPRPTPPRPYASFSYNSPTTSTTTNIKSPPNSNLNRHHVELVDEMSPLHTTITSTSSTSILQQQQHLPQSQNLNQQHHPPAQDLLHPKSPNQSQNRRDDMGVGNKLSGSSRQLGDGPLVSKSNSPPYAPSPSSSGYFGSSAWRAGAGGAAAAAVPSRGVRTTRDHDPDHDNNLLPLKVVSPMEAHAQNENEIENDNYQSERESSQSRIFNPTSNFKSTSTNQNYNPQNIQFKALPPYESPGSKSIYHQLKIKDDGRAGDSTTTTTTTANKTKMSVTSKSKERSASFVSPPLSNSAGSTIRTRGRSINLTVKSDVLDPDADSDSDEETDEDEDVEVRRRRRRRKRADLSGMGKGGLNHPHKDEAEEEEGDVEEVHEPEIPKSAPLKAPQLTYTSAVVIGDETKGREESHQESELYGQIVNGNDNSNSLSMDDEESRNRPVVKSILDLLENPPNISCWREPPPPARKSVSVALTREMRSQMEVLSGSTSMAGFSFDILNLVRKGQNNREWNKVGNVSVETPEVHLETIRWPGGGIFGPGERPSKAYRVVTITAPPFVMEAEAEDNRTCVKGIPCLKVNTNNKDDLALIFADFERGKPGAFQLACCDGLAMDLLSSVGRELKFEIDLYLVPDGYFGSRTVSSNNTGEWNGIMRALISGAAHMSFAPISVTSTRATAVDFSTPYFFSGVSLLGVSRNRDVPLLAFLAPFSVQLWAAIFIALNMTALVVALYEWFSPFGLNPWGRQRTKNFSMASALWVVWGRLFSHLVAFKAPKSWPNKFLINVWGGFSVIFVASYTANIAALFAGMFFERAVDVNDRSLLSQRVAAVKHSATDWYIKRENPLLWEHIQTFPVKSFQQGVDMLKNASLDLLIGDGPLLDYYRGTDPSCTLIDVSEHDKIGDDTYAVAMARGFPLRESISSLIAKYIANGYMDYLQGKWYGQMACFRTRSQSHGARALGVEAVAGMFIMLGVGMGVGLLILVLELIVYKYALPFFRSQPRGTVWRSINLMFFSQKLYRFINCVELVSPHHAAKELVNTLRHGQITSLFQKSVKRKEHEQRRRRKSKAQFFEMIQEIRRVQRQDRQQGDEPKERKSSKEKEGGEEEPPGLPIYSIQARLESLRQTPKVIRILGEHVEFQDHSSPPRTSSSTLPTCLSTDQLSYHSDENPNSRKPSRGSIFSSHRNSDAFSDSRVSLNLSQSQSPRMIGLSGSVSPIPSSTTGFSVGQLYEGTSTGGLKPSRCKTSTSKSEKTKDKDKRSKPTSSSAKTITMSTTIVKSSGDKKPLKTILKRANNNAPGCSSTSNFSLPDTSSLSAIGKKLAAPSSPTPSIARITKGAISHVKKKPKKSTIASKSHGYPSSKRYGTGYKKEEEPPQNSSSDENDNESEGEIESDDVSAAERAEILTVNLTTLSKNEVIDLWRSSEADLRSQLSQALKTQEELTEKLRSVAVESGSGTQQRQQQQQQQQQQQEDDNTRKLPDEMKKDEIESKLNPHLKKEEFQPP